jgi:hypothetical protein
MANLWEHGVTHFSRTAVAQLDPKQFDAAVQLVVGSSAQDRVNNWLCDSGYSSRVRIGVIGVYEDAGQVLFSRAKVMVGADFFMHQEPYNEFPSDHFKAKVALVCG